MYHYFLLVCWDYVMRSTGRTYFYLLFLLLQCCLTSEINPFSLLGYPSNHPSQITSPTTSSPIGASSQTQTRPLITNPSTSTPSSSSSSSSSWTYDVFLSFRGPDTRDTFTKNLNSRLLQLGVKTFIDNVQLPRGEAISSNLSKAIRQSKISVIIFSANFASSQWCLDELVEILKCKASSSRHQIVYPIFYKVDPSDVRTQRGKIGEALAAGYELRSSNDGHMERWRLALTQAGTLSGWHLPVNGYEPDFIDDLVRYISNQVSDRIHLHVAKYPVGIEPRVNVVIKYLRLHEQSTVRTVGIWGGGGMGKTTIAKAVYNSIINRFEFSCFLRDVSKNSSHDGLVKLQNILLSQILTGNLSHIRSVDQGITELRKRLNKHKILLVLDDVNDLEQLKKLAGSPSWFGPGSTIIITTTDRDLLTRHGVTSTYEINKLNDREATDLFKLNVSRGKGTERREGAFDVHVKQAVHYSDGIPLVLEVLGSYLSGKDINEWQEALRSSINSPEPQIAGIFSRSFGALGTSKQEVFLYIACIKVLARSM